MSNNRRKIGQVFCCIRCCKILLILFFTAFVGTHTSFAQNESFQSDSTTYVTIPIHLESLKQSNLHWYERIIPFYKAQEKKRERFHKQLQDLLNGDSLLTNRTESLNKLISQLADSISEINNSLEILSNDSLFIANIDSLSKAIGIQQSSLDSLKTILSVTTTVNEKAYLTEIYRFRNGLKPKLNEIREVQFACKSGYENPDSLEVNDSIVRFTQCLKPKTHVLGWYKSWSGDKYQSFNFNYLSAVNLYGYKLEENGRLVKPKGANFHALSSKAIENGCEVYLTVYCKDSHVISKFLNDSIAQEGFYKTLEVELQSLGAGGVVINFEDVFPKYASQFTHFINKVSQIVLEQNRKIKINITLPGDKGDLLYASSKAYEFEFIDHLVERYIILTDDLSSENEHIGKSNSPLNTLEGSNSITSSVEFYTKGLVHPSKLTIVTSYLGVKYQTGFTDNSNRAFKQKEYITYSSLKSDYLNTLDSNISILNLGRDTVQMSTFASIKSKDTLFHFWFEDEKDIASKFQMVLDNPLGGVSIKGLGDDDGYEEFWNVIGTTLTEIDTTILGKKKKSNTKQESLQGFWHIFLEDLDWANDKEIKIRNTSLNDSVYCSLASLAYMVKDTTMYFTQDSKYFCSKQNCDSFNVTTASIYSFCDQPPIKKDIWKIQTYNPLSENEISNCEECFYLQRRFLFYLRVSGITSIAFFVIGLVLALLILRLNLKLENTGLTYKLCRIGLTASLILGVIFLIVWMYFSPSIQRLFSGGSNSNLPMYFATGVVGLILGILITYSLIKAKYHKSDLP